MYVKVEDDANVCGDYVLPWNLTANTAPCCNLTTWTGTASTDWDDANNWDTYLVPTACNDVIIPTGTPNQSTIGGTTTAEAASVTVATNATLDIATGGILNLETDGIDNNGSITNSGFINVGLTTTVPVPNAISNYGSFTNDGTITTGLVATTGGGINIQTFGPFENNGSIVVGPGWGVVGDFGIGVYNNGLLTNNGTIENTSGSIGAFLLMQGAPAEILNYGVIDLNTAGVRLSFGGTLTNAACGEILEAAFNIDAGCLVDNSGLITTLGGSNNGTWDNSGTIHSLSAVISSPNAINNDDLIIQPVTLTNACGELSPAFGIGPNLGSTVSICTDAAATSSAGTYDAGTNTFTPNFALSNTTYNLFVKVVDDANTCTDYILPWNLTVNYVSPPEITNFVSTGTTCQSAGAGVQYYGTPGAAVNVDIPGVGNHNGVIPASGTSGFEFFAPAGTYTATITSVSLDGCDGVAGQTVDFTILPLQIWYADTDEDGFGDTNSSIESCDQPTGFVLDNSDCNDNDNTIYPGAVEVCDGQDNNCNGLIDTFDPTLVDNIAPEITSCPGNITVGNDPGDCGATVPFEAIATDNCGVTLSYSTAPGSSFPIGTTSVTATATDVAGNSVNCSFTVTVEKTGDPDLFYAYTVIGFDEVKMKENTVLSGGVGVVNNGKKAKLEHGTQVTAANTFVKAPVLDLKSGSQVGTYYPGPVDASLLPNFQSGSYCNNEVEFPDNSGPATLDLACYKKIKVGKNVSATFSGHASVSAKELELKEGASVTFAQSTSLLLDKKLDAGKNVSISNGGNEVWIFANDEVKIDEGNNVTVNIYSQKKLKVEKADGNPTYMNGIFIADKVDSKENVYWNWDANTCPYFPPALPLAGIVEFKAVAGTTNGKAHVDLHWLTNEDYRNGHFEVEKSSEGIQFSPVVEKVSSHDDTEIHLYRSADPNPAEGVWFYRLKLVRTDGTIGYSAPQKVRIELPDNYVLFPNPASEQVRVDMTESVGKPAVLQLVNGQGLIIRTQQFDGLPDGPVTFELDGCKDGIYWLNVQVEGKRSRALKFVVANNVAVARD